MLLVSEGGKRGRNRSEDELTLQKSVLYRLVSSFSHLSFISETHKTFDDAIGGKEKGKLKGL